MKKFLFGVLFGAAGVYAYNHVTRDTPTFESVDRDQEASETPEVEAPDQPRFHCDGRQYCSQMTSCEEAMFFLENCPDVKMDGGGDGIPCERQWCKGRG